MHVRPVPLALLLAILMPGLAAAEGYLARVEATKPTLPSERHDAHDCGAGVSGPKESVNAMLAQMAVTDPRTGFPLADLVPPCIVLDLLVACPECGELLALHLAYNVTSGQYVARAATAGADGPVVGVPPTRLELGGGSGLSVQLNCRTCTPPYVDGP